MINFIKKVFSIIDKKDKRRLVAIFFVILISSLLDLVGISALLPIVSLLSNPNPADAIANSTVLSILSNLFHITEASTLSIISLLFMGIVFIIKTAYAFFVTYVTIKFSTSFSRRLSIKLIRIHLSMPYEYHHENNTSTLIRKSTYDADIFTSAVNGFLTFMVRITTAVALIGYLFYTSWLITLIIGTLLTLFALLILIILRRKTKILGKNIQQLTSNNYKYLSQAFNGIKESKISNTESYFINEYNKNIKMINHYSLRRSMYSSIPGHALELVGMLGMIISLLLIILVGKDTNHHIVEMFAVFVYAVLKLLPCVTEITSYINNFSFYSSSIDTIDKDLKEAEQLEKIIDTIDNHEIMEFNNLININSISFAYKDEPDKNVLTDISFKIKKNTSVAISGKSGAGKTTLVDIILGLLNPTKGEIDCDNCNIRNNLRGWRDNLSYIPQNIYLTDDTIRNNVAFGLKQELIKDEAIWDALEKAQLKDFVQQSPKGLDTIIGERGIRLSGGQRQRIGIARAFYRNTNVIVFDEATSALDYETEKNILNHVSKYSKDHTLIIITHRLNTIESCDYIYQIADGKISVIK